VGHDALSGDLRARPHIRQRIIARVLMQHQPSGFSADEKRPFICSCGEPYATGPKGDGLAKHQANFIQRALDTPREKTDG
jgi:hypothetical protein